ncbi:cytochrome P450 [Zafaria cholistanensis]|uniref:Cytochrome P450 n=1 Tax=Zafaria cholistanensis TaxID=1682741 RepID=A0A5A7NQ88_9MICC|nr:cytochrome P450 [Zafaria cholistanensis]GER23104.1 cytochrome P450 [Zafaria cholistanensis]
MIPSLRIPEVGLSFLLRGYTTISWHCDRLETDAFYGRLLGRRTLFLRGLDAARLVYQPGAFPRAGALPLSAVALLQDLGSVQQLEGHAHDRRKALFLRIVSPGHAGLLANAFEAEFEASLPRWRSAGRVALHRELVEVLTRAVLRWAGAGTEAAHAGELARELDSMVAHAGSFGPPNWHARLLRRRTEAWARNTIRAARSGKAGAEPGDDPLQALALFTEADGSLLEEGTAAVELLNVLRPVVATSRFLAFAALALEQNPAWARNLAAEDPADLRCFAQEVRRTTPFFPAAGGLAAREFQWDGETVAPGTRVMVDLYGTNLDPRLWKAPRAFDPDRFRGGACASALVPQGTGDPLASHRCPGEDTALALVERATVLFLRHRLRLPAQDLTVDLRRIPALPRSGIVASFG